MPQLLWLPFFTFQFLTRWERARLFLASVALVNVRVAVAFVQVGQSSRLPWPVEVSRPCNVAPLQ